MLPCSVIAIACLFAGAYVPGAENRVVRNTGLFSNMHYDDESGDVLGMEVFVTYSGRGYFVVYQSSEGEPMKPVVVPAKVSGTSITFAIPSDIDPRGTFTGTMTEEQLMGTFSGNQETVRLKRGDSYWQ